MLKLPYISKIPFPDLPTGHILDMFDGAHVKKYVVNKHSLYIEMFSVESHKKSLSQRRGDLHQSQCLLHILWHKQVRKDRKQILEF